MRDVAGVDARVSKIMALKAPGSGESAKNLWANLAHLGAGDEIKMVLADEADYAWAREVLMTHRLTERCSVLLSPVAGSLAPAQLADWVLRDKLDVRFQLQLHKALWGNQRGV